MKRRATGEAPLPPRWCVFPADEDERRRGTRWAEDAGFNVLALVRLRAAGKARAAGLPERAEWRDVYAELDRLEREWRTDD